MAKRVRLSEKTFNRYQDALTCAHRKFEAEAQPIIERMTAYFKGDQWPSTTKDTSIPKVVANLIFADIKVMLPMLTLRNPRIFCKPTAATTMLQLPGPPGPDGMPTTHALPAQVINGAPIPVMAAARAKEALVNYRWRDLRTTQQVRRCLLDSFLAPFGIMKLGYTLETEKIEPPTPSEAEQSMLEGQPVTGELIELNEIIKANAPYAVRWSPSDFRVDPEARYPDLSDAAWIAFGWKARLEDLQRNPRFSNTRNLKATVEVKLDYPGASQAMSRRPIVTGSTDDWKRVQCWEVWDKRTGTRIVLADDHDKALEYVDWPTLHRGFPARTLYSTEYPDTLYGLPDLYQVLTQQNAYNELNAMILNHVKRFLRKYLVTAGFVDEKEQRKLLEPIDGLFVEVQGDPQKGIAALPDANIPVDWWQARANFRDDHDRTSGVADFIRGVAEKVDTATEAGLLQSNLNVRTNDARDVVETFAEGVAAELLHIDGQTLDVPAAVPIVGPDGALALGQFLQISTRETLLADTDVEIEIGSMQPMSQMLKKRDMLEVYTLGRNDPMFDQMALRRRLLSVYQDTIPDGETLLLPPEQAQMAMMALMAGGPGGMGGPPGGAPGPRPTPPAALGPRRVARPAAPVRPPMAPPPTAAEEV